VDSGLGCGEGSAGSSKLDKGSGERGAVSAAWAVPRECIAGSRADIEGGAPRGAAASGWSSHRLGLPCAGNVHGWGSRRHLLGLFILRQKSSNVPPIQRHRPNRRQNQINEWPTAKKSKLFGVDHFLPSMERIVVAYDSD
jgi:hypothetical protein